MTGRVLSNYELLEEAGHGGMGVVYKARDRHLDRFVAVKVLPPGRTSDPDRLRRFVQEAKAASALNHPNIVVIHDIDHADGVDFIVMELIDGRPLQRIIASEKIALSNVLQWGVEIAGALAAAHAAGIVHRDIKPANIMINSLGHAKVLDFGLAKLVDPIGQDAETKTAEAATQPGAVMGTAAYMSPEQAEGKPVDARSDVFSLGAVLYEMLSGRRAFQGESQVSTLAAILRDSPPPLRNVRPEAPPELARIIDGCLKKDRDQRYASAVEVRNALAAFQARRAAPGARALLRPAIAIPAFIVLTALAAGVGWLWRQNARAREARDVWLPEAARLRAQFQSHAALKLLRNAERYIPEDPQLRQLRDSVSQLASIRSVPASAEVAIKDYSTPDAPWEVLGVTPLDNIRVPSWNLRWKVSKPGFETAERAQFLSGSSKIEFTLDAQGAAPGMVRVPAGEYLFRDSIPISLAEYRIDKYEVTNRQFKEFVDHGAYQKRDYWTQPFAKDGRALNWESAMAEFRDGTGRPGPASWDLGAYAEGQPDFPVGGVSWYEAEAYCESAGKSLPSVYHWYNAAGTGIISDILFFSNFDHKGPARVGSYQSLGAYGAYDMAGNVKEWCWNPAGEKRYILGGAWSEPHYMFNDLDAKPPLDRAVANGFRCAQYMTPVAETLTAAIQVPSRDYAKAKPADDAAFALIRSLYAYDPGPLKAQVEATDDSHPHWRHEKVSYNAAYGNERVIGHLFLPRNAAPPYETVIFFPGANAIEARSSDNLAPDLLLLDFLMRSGRAVLFPVYKGTYERHIDPNDTNAWRETVIQSSKDVRRSVDYLQTRQDIDGTKLAYYGISFGANRGPAMTAFEARFKAVVLLAGGLPPVARPPESDPINFAPRVTAPTLMLNGRYDFECPLTTCSQPLFHFLGAPEKDKRLVVYEAGHIPADVRPVIREILDWLDHYLGPVKTNR